MDDGSSLPLLVWLSPAFPVGSFAYSHGLEWAHEAGDVVDFETCREWIADLVSSGSGRNEAIIVAETWRAMCGADFQRLDTIIELSLALQPSSERYLESTMQGKAFLTNVRAAWSNEALDNFSKHHKGDITYPVAIGIVSATYKIALPQVLEAFLTAFVSNLVSACVRLGAIGQTDGQRVIAALMPLIREEAHNVQSSTLDDLGSCVFRSDLASLLHETQYTRLFRS